MMLTAEGDEIAPGWHPELICVLRGSSEQVSISHPGSEPDQAPPHYIYQDPEMTVRLFPPGMTIFQQLAPSTDPGLGRLEALSFQQACPPLYQRIYPEPGSYHRNLRNDLNDFLGHWLRNLKGQGHRLDDSD